MYNRHAISEYEREIIKERHHLSAGHHQAEHSRWQHLSRRPVRVGPRRGEKLSRRVRKEVVLRPQPWRGIRHRYLLLHQGTGNLQYRYREYSLTYFVRGNITVELTPIRLIWIK